MTVFVVIPWRPGCSHRENALAFVSRWWATRYPDWPVTVGAWPERFGPWRKGCAVRAAAVRATSADVVVVSDADVIPTGAGHAVDTIRRPGVSQAVALWCVPFRGVYRLTESGTRIAINGGVDLMTGPPRGATGLIEESYVGSPGGGTVVIRGDVLAEIPIDPRFAGYGQEDTSWSLALHMLAGAPSRIMSPLWHLWHPPQPRMRRGPTTSRGVGSEAGLKLWQRYRSATTPDTMRRLVGEARASYTRLMEYANDHSAD